MKIWIPRFVEQKMAYCAISRLCIFSTLNYNLCSFTFGIGLNYCSHFSQCLTICVWRAKFQMWASVHMTSVHNFHTYGKVLLNLKYLPSQTSGCCKGLWKPVIEHFNFNLKSMCLKNVRMNLNNQNLANGTGGRWLYETRLKLKGVRLVISESMSGCIKLICFGLKYIRMRQIICQIVPRECIRKYYP